MSPTLKAGIERAETEADALTQFRTTLINRQSYRITELEEELSNLYGYLHMLEDDLIRSVLENRSEVKYLSQRMRDIELSMEDEGVKLA